MTGCEAEAVVEYPAALHLHMQVVEYPTAVTFGRGNFHAVHHHLVLVVVALLFAHHQFNGWLVP